MQPEFDILYTFKQDYDAINTNTSFFILRIILIHNIITYLKHEQYQYMVSRVGNEPSQGSARLIRNFWPRASYERVKSAALRRLVNCKNTLCQQSRAMPITTRGASNNARCLQQCTTSAITSDGNYNTRCLQRRTMPAITICLSKMDGKLSYRFICWFRVF